MTTSSRSMWPNVAVVLGWQTMELDQIYPEWLSEAALAHNEHRNLLGRGRSIEELSLWAITRVDLSGNNLEKLIPDITCLPSLHILNVSSNRISQLPGTVAGRDSEGEIAWTCHVLEELNVQGNVLTTLPSGIFSLPSLQKLNASHNTLTDVPSGAWACECLVELNLSYNNFEKLDIVPDLGEASPSQADDTSQEPTTLQKFG